MPDVASDKAALNKRFTTIAWASFLVMWGVTLLIDVYAQVGLRNVQYILAGLILLGLNGARHWKGIPMSRVTLIVGLMATLGGILRQLTGEFSILGVALVALGSVILAQGLMMTEPGDDGGKTQRKA